NVGVPGDTLGALTVGTQAQGKPIAGSLMTKPDVSMQASVKVGDANVGGPAVAAGFVGGVVACLAEAKIPGAYLPRTFGIPTGQSLSIPQEWLDSLSPKQPR
ncbi:MAG: hypothetical protein ACRCZF_06215, partial [Gemmataceae bacterium]